jgi:hypothetical protein
MIEQMARFSPAAGDILRGVAATLSTMRRFGR